MLPSGYKYAISVHCRTANYIDTGVYPASNMVLDALLVARLGYSFGARNTNSNTSQGQMNLFLENNQTNYFGFGNQRLALGFTDFSSPSMTHIHVDGNQIEIVIGNENIVNLTGTTTAFTGTRTMYLGTMNNAGTPFATSACDMYGFRVYEGGALTHDFVPCYSEAISHVGMYDLVAEEFKPVYNYQTDTATYYHIQVQANGGGIAYCQIPHGERTSEYYSYRISPTLMDRLFAIPEPQYAFVNWTNSNGDVVSTEPNYEFAPSQDETFTANFVKITDLMAWHGFKAMAIKYGVKYSESSLRDDFYCDVVSANVAIDAMQRSTTTINVRSVPDIYQPLMPIVLLNPKGKVIYCGIIQAIEGNTITCREALSIFDEDFLFHNNTNIGGTNWTTRSVLQNLWNLSGQSIKRFNDDSAIGENPLQRRKYYPIVVRRNTFVPFDESRVFTSCTPLISQANVSNFEDYLLEMFNSFGVYVRTSLQFGRRSSSDVYDSHYFLIKPTYDREMDTLNLSDNVENISNVVVTSQEMETTVLAIYNSAGTSLRQFVGIKKDGTYMAFDQNTLDTELQKLIGYNNYKIKVITSDDNINTIRAQNLSNAMYNHKITFTLAIDNRMFGIDTIQIGQPVDFYYKDKLYRSVVTGITFDINANDDAITMLNITLGKVRTSLSSKLNLGKVR